MVVGQLVLKNMKIKADLHGHFSTLENFGNIFDKAMKVAQKNLGPGGLFAVVNGQDQGIGRYETFLKNEVDNGKIQGAVSLVVRNGKIVHEASFGYRNFDNKTPMTTDDIFYIQSMTKPIIAVAFMMLYEEGHFLLTDPVSN